MLMPRRRHAAYFATISRLSRIDRSLRRHVTSCHAYFATPPRHARHAMPRGSVMQQRVCGSGGCAVRSIDVRVMQYTARHVKHSEYPRRRALRLIAPAVCAYMFIAMPPRHTPPPLSPSPQRLFAFFATFTPLLTLFSRCCALRLQYAGTLDVIAARLRDDI